MTKIIALPPRPARISAKLRVAIDLRVKNGLTIAEACKKAGLSQAGWHKAMARPAVVRLVREVQEKFVAEVDMRRAYLRAQAYEVAAELLRTATSETVKVRLIELLAGDGKQPGVSVHVDARMPPQGYIYRRPVDGAPVIEGSSEPLEE